MKLIDEKEVEEAALNDEGFIAGVTFAEQKLLPMIVEFAEWLDDNMWTQYESEDKQYVNVGKWYNTTSFQSMKDPQTIEQLIEQFISRDK